jgi:hypothetical protein
MSPDIKHGRVLSISLGQLIGQSGFFEFGTKAEFFHRFMHDSACPAFRNILYALAGLLVPEFLGLAFGSNRERACPPTFSGKCFGDLVLRVRRYPVSPGMADISPGNSATDDLSSFPTVAKFGGLSAGRWVVTKPSKRGMARQENTPHHEHQQVPSDCITMSAPRPE